jgi:formylglycine-generating enzyme required for sulfatase activity
MGRSQNGTDACSIGDSDELPEHSALVDDFYLDVFEVTVGRFRKFVQSYSGQSPAEGAGDHHGLGAGWQSVWMTNMPANQDALISQLKGQSDFTWTDVPGANENRAINNVNWFVAMDFCLWDGGRLPTEAEWEYAAAGGTDNRLYPWGAAEPDSNLANYYNSDRSPFVDVGSHPSGKGKWQQQDLGGGMWEWVVDIYSSTWYTGQGASCENCAYVSNPSDYLTRVVRGGGWSAWGAAESNIRSVLRAANRGTSSSFPYNYVGFRCARNK